MSRLSDKFKEASEMTKQLTDSAETRLDRLLARRKKIKDHEDKAFVPHESALDGLEDNLDQFESDMKMFSNEPLPGSGK